MTSAATINGRPKNRITAGAIRKALSGVFAAPEYAVMFEVAESTGAFRGRAADAVVMSLWPSRGLELHGYEIKVSRSDWKREAVDPTKAEAIARYCDRWWVIAAPGVVEPIELPPAWGLREFDGKRIKTIREAQKTTAEPVERSFLAALLRRADGAMRDLVAAAAEEGQREVEEDKQRLRDQYAQDVERAVARRTEELRQADKNRAAFEAAFGDDFLLNWGVDHAAVGAAAKALAKCSNRGFGPLSKQLREAADRIDEIQTMVDPSGEVSQ